MADHDHDHSELSETQLRVRALETILTEKGYIDPAALDAIVETYETKVGPRNGAAVVARAWTDPGFRQALLKDATAAVATLGHISRVGDHLVAVENTPQRHNMIVCTLCSCYPWEVLGLPPVPAPSTFRAPPRNPCRRKFISRSPITSAGRWPWRRTCWRAVCSPRRSSPPAGRCNRPSRWRASLRPMPCQEA